MTCIIVTGHGSFASALLETAGMIVGSTDGSHPVDFPVGTGVDDLTERLRALIATEHAERPDESVLILADLLGGSPARVALAEAAAGRAEVVTGVNLPMLVDILLAGSEATAKDLAARAVTNGQEGIRDLGPLLREQGASA